jgi:AcrR family transcriptional regulator
MSASPPARGRENQKLRTRKALLDAAGRLMRSGVAPSLEEVAEEALVSRATAYRYFPSFEALMLEAAVHVGVPEPEAVFEGFDDDDPAGRLQRVDEVLHEAVAGAERPFRLMLANLLQQSAAAPAAELPARQNRRAGMIAAALAPSADQFAPQALEDLSHAVAMLVGTEGFIVARDVLGLDDSAALRIKAWAIEALVAAARREGAGS